MRKILKNNWVDICIFVIVMLFFLGLFYIAADTQSNMQEITETQQNCNHEFITTSEYSYWRGLYRTISKCIKCGYVIR